jgi:putative hydrolases of HD superfamily
MDSDEKIVNFFFEIATLRRMIRNHKQVLAGASDNISDHSFRVAIIGMILAKMEECDSNKVVKMCLFHDICEARTGDANWVHQQYIKSDEDAAREDQMEGLPIKNDISALLAEYEERESLEAKVAKDADLLDQMILQQEYLYERDFDRGKWQDHTEEQLLTENAKALAKTIRGTNPMEWVYQISDDKNKHKD